MEYLTLHELSLRLDVSVRVLRSRLHQLLQAGKLCEDVDCKRDGYVDETHFVWLVNPVAFMQVTGLQPAAPAFSPLSSTATQSVNQVVGPASHAATPPPDRPDQILPKVAASSPGLEREVIDLLKDQMRVKDTQIADLSEQNKSLNSLHLKLTGQIVQQADRIQDLLRLTGGKTELTDADTQPVNHSVNPATAAADPDNPFDSHESNVTAAEHEQGSAQAA